MTRSMFAVALTSSLLAQGGPIYIVDANSGPGTNFTDIQAAVLAVPDGSTLLVRPATYAPVVIYGKGITILGDPSFAISYSTVGPLLVVQGTQVHQRVLVRGFANGGLPFGELIHVMNAAGPVTLDGLHQSLWSDTASALVIAGSPQVDIRNWSILSYAPSQQPTCRVTNSSVVFEQCSLVGANAPSHQYPVSGQPGLSVSASYVELVHTTVRGGSGSLFAFTIWPGSAAVVMNGGSLRALGLASHSITGGTTPGTGQLAGILGTGVARVDPNIFLSAAPTGVSLTRPTMPSLLSNSAQPGGFLIASRYGAPGVLFVIALSLRAPSITLPWLPDPIWLDPLSMIVEAAGIAPSGPFVVQMSVPTVATLRGFQFVWQAADFDPTGLVAVSNPSPGFVH